MADVRAWRLLVAEDEAPQREALCALLRSLRPHAVVQACEDGLAALEWLDANPVDLALLDIRMPGASGLEVAERVLARGGEVVFTTAFEAHALRAFEQGAVDYLLKPLQPARVREALERFERRRGPGGAFPSPIDLAGLAKLLESAAPPRLRWINASLGDTLRVIAVDDVLAFHADDKLTRVLTAEGDALIRAPLKELAPRLDPVLFSQAHRSLIVRLSAIDRVRKDELGRHVLTLKGREARFAVSQGALARLRTL